MRINCPSEREPEPDWDRWERDGYDGGPPPYPGTDTVIEIPF